MGWWECRTGGIRNHRIEGMQEGIVTSPNYTRVQGFLFALYYRLSIENLIIANEYESPTKWVECTRVCGLVTIRNLIL